MSQHFRNGFIAALIAILSVLGMDNAQAQSRMHHHRTVRHYHHRGPVRTRVVVRHRPARRSRVVITHRPGHRTRVVHRTVTHR